MSLFGKKQDKKDEPKAAEPIKLDLDLSEKKPQIGEGFKKAKEKAQSVIGSVGPAGSGEGVICPDCGKGPFKHINKHKCKEKKKESKLDPDLLKILEKIKGRLGGQTVKVLVHILEYAKQRQFDDPEQKFVCPAGWLQETGELHGEIIEFCLKKYGPEESEIYIIVMSAIAQWYAALQLNFLEQHGPSKQLGGVRTEGIRKDTDSPFPDEKRATVIDS